MAGNLDVGTVSGALEMRDMATRVVRQFGTQLSALEKQLVATEAASKRANFGAALDGLANKALIAGTALTAGVTLPLIGVMKATMDASATFDKEMTRVITLVGVAEKQVQAWRGELLSMAGEVGVGPNELARALFVVTSAGIRTQEAMNIVKQSAQAAAVGLGETATIARTVTAVMQAYGEANMTSQRAVDVLTATVREGNLVAEDLAGTLGRVVGVASQVGVSFEQVGSFIATFTRLGVNSAESVTALRGILNTFLKTGAQARETLAQFGLTAEQVRSVIKEQGLAAALGMLVDTFKGNEDALARVVPNIRAFSGLLGTAGAQGKAYREILRSIEQSHNMTADGFKRTAQTMAFGWAQLKAETEALAIKTGDRLAPALSKVQDAAVPTVQAVTKLVDAFAALPDNVQQFAVAAALLTGPLTLVVGLVTKFWGLIAGAAGLLGNLVRWFATSRGALFAMNANFELVGTTIGGLVFRFLGLIGIVTTLVGALWKLSQSNNETARTAASAAGPVGMLMVAWRNLKTYVLDAGVAIDGVSAKLNKWRIAQQKELTKREFPIPTMDQAQATYREVREKELLPQTGTRDFMNQLANARSELSKLNADTIKAMKAMVNEAGGSAEDLQKNFGLSELAAKVFVEQMQKAKGAIKDAAQEAEKLADAIKGMTGGEAIEKAQLAMKALATGVMPQGEGVQQTLDTLMEGYQALTRLGEPVSNEMLAWIDYLQQMVLQAGAFADMLTLWNNRWEEVDIGGKKMTDILGEGWGAGAGSPLGYFADKGSGYGGKMTQQDLIERGFWSPQEWEEAGKAMAKPFGVAFMDRFKDVFTNNEGWGGFGANLAQTIVGAFQGGGNVGRTIGASLGGGIGSATGSAIGDAMKGLGGMAPKLVSMVGGFLGPIGSVLGGLVGKLFEPSKGKLLGMEADKNIAALKDQLLQTYGSLENIKKVGGAAGEALAAAWGSKNVAGLEHLTKLAKEFEAAVAAAKERVEKLTEELGTLADSGDLISRDLIERVMKDVGNADVRGALGDFMKANTGRAVEGLTAFISLPKTLMDGLETAREKVVGLRNAEADLVAKMTDLEGKDHLTAQQARDLDETRTKLAEIRAELAQAESSVDKFGSALQNITLNPATASALQAGLGGLFGSLLMQGASPIDAILQLAPAIQTLDDQMEGLGLATTPAFDELIRLASIATDEVSGPLLQAVAGLGQGLVGLHNVGLLTSDMFAGLARGAYDAFHTLELQGQGGTDAVRMMQPTLQRIWELQQDFGYEVDENTQKLLDFAAANGLVGDKFRPAADKMAAALEMLVGKFDVLIALLNDRLPQAADDGASQVNSALDQIDFEDVARRGVDAFGQIEAAATSAAWGSSPTGIKEIPIATQEALDKLAQFGAYATQVFASIEDMAATYAHTVMADGDKLGALVQGLAYQLADLTATPLGRQMNAIERDLMSTLAGLAKYADDPRYAQAVELAQQVADLRGREAWLAEKERQAAEANRASASSDAKIEQIVVVHLDGQVLTQATIKGLPEKVRVLAR